MGHKTIEGLSDFLLEYPGMAIRPSRGLHTLVRGDFQFIGQNEAAGIIQDNFKLEILIPPDFPKDLPKVTEIGERIPRNDDTFHVNQTDFSLCLGSPVGLLMKLSKAPPMVGFAEHCLIPYLYAISHKLNHGGTLLFGELAHGTPGMLADYINIFRLKSPYQVRDALRLLGMKKRRANKLPCPCGCGRRTGVCKFNWTLREFRQMGSRAWFRAQLLGWTLPPIISPKPISKKDKISTFPFKQAASASVFD